MADVGRSPRGTLIVERLRGHLANGSFTRALKSDGRWNVISIDVVPRLRRRPVRLVRMGAAAMRQYGPDIVAGRRTFRDVLWRTPTAMRIMRQEVLEAIAEQRIDPPVATIQIQSMFDGHVPGVPHFVYTDHTHLANRSYPSFTDDQLYASSWIACEREVYQHARLCFVRSPNVAASLQRDYGVHADAIRFAYAGPNSEIDHEAMAQPERSCDIVFVGVDWERKGGPVLAEAFARLRSTFPDATLTVVGCTPPQGPGMQVVGRVPLERIGHYLSSAAIFCLPTRIEPFGIAIIEAMARGLPIVATEVGAIPDIVENGANGILVAPDDVDALAAALGAFLSSPAARLRAGARSREIAEERYTWEAVLGRMAPALDEALAEAA